MDSRRRKRLIRFCALGIAGCLLGVIVALVVWPASDSRATRDSYMRLLRGNAQPVTVDKELQARIEAFCSDCHGPPDAENYPRDAWHKKVQRGYEFYAKSGRNDLDPPPMRLTLAYYRSLAPEQVVFPDPVEAETELSARFTVEKVAWDEDINLSPDVSHLLWTRLDEGEAPVLVACDMRRGGITAIDLRERPLVPKLLARLKNPCHVQPCDLDQDNRTDLVVADLGSFNPDDHNRGRVVWLRCEEPETSYEEVVLASGLGRIADVQPADLDHDGDPDLLVAEFGWEKTGSIVLLKNDSADGERPHFEPKELDPRPGAIHVPVTDLDGDGRLDFVALVSQHYECVEAFLNQGEAKFHLRTLWAGPDPAFGSSGIELVDLDQDGDPDILYTNGDAFDDAYVKPCHGVGWLENLGDLQFTHHRLTDLPGAYRALAGDIDLDGDLDVIAVAWVPRPAWPLTVVQERLASIVCLEQTSSGNFVRHTLETGLPYHAVIELADFDNDGDLDFAVGSNVMSPTQRLPHSLAIWWNQTVSPE